jgi:eukaryotic-like serine/threonine-protein kinase
MTPETNHLYQFGPFTLDAEKRLLVGDEKVVALTPRAFDILLALVQNRGSVLEKDELMKLVWPDSFVEEANLSVNISALRKALGEKPNEHRYIVTIPGRGYRFVAVTREVKNTDNRLAPAEHANVGAAALDKRGQQDRTEKASLGRDSTVDSIPSEADQGMSKPITTTKPNPKSRFAIVIGLGMLVTAALGAAWWMTRSRAPANPPVLKRLTWDSGLTTDPALSPDGRLLAYASDRGGEGNLDIWVQQLTGGEARGEPVRLTRDPAEDSEPTFSPDGSVIAFSSTRGGGGIYLISATGGQERLLAKQGHRPRFSPDGRWITYWVGNIWWNSSTSLILPLSGGTARQLQPDFEVVAFPTWSPDGKHVMFLGRAKSDSREEGWWVAPVEGGAAARTGISISTIFPSTRPPFSPPEWTSSGRIIFSKSEPASANLWQLSLSSETFQVATQPERLTLGATLEVRPSFASGYLAFSSLAQASNIWSLPTDHLQGKATGEVRALTQDTSYNGVPSISTDGTKLAFISGRSGGMNGWIKDLGSGRVTPLSSHSSRMYSFLVPRISGDGSKVAYKGDLGVNSRIYLTNVDDLSTRILCEKCGGPGDWLPDGRKLLLYLLPGHKRVDSLDVISGERTQVIRDSSHILVQPHLSPDGGWIVLHSDISEIQVRIMLVPLRNGVAASEEEWLAVTDGFGIDRDANWSPDGNLLYFFSERDGFRCIWAQRLEPANKRPVGSPFAVYHSHDRRRSLKNVGLLQLSMSVSPNQIVFPLGELTGNIWITELEGQRQ